MIDWMELGRSSSILVPGLTADTTHECWEKEGMGKWRFRIRVVQKGNIWRWKWNRRYINHSSWIALTFSVKQEMKKPVRIWQTIKKDHMQTKSDYCQICYIFFQSLLMAFMVDLSVLTLPILPPLKMIINSGTRALTVYYSKIKPIF